MSRSAFCSDATAFEGKIVQTEHEHHVRTPLLGERKADRVGECGRSADGVWLLDRSVSIEPRSQRNCSSFLSANHPSPTRCAALPSPQGRGRVIGAALGVATRPS